MQVGVNPSLPRIGMLTEIIPGITSIYRWKGTVEQDQEALLLVKTGQESWQPLAERIRELHPYELPELVAVPVADGLPAYLQWVTDEIRR